MSLTTPKRPPQFLAATVAAFMTVGLAGCSSDPEQYVHCVDEDGEVVDPDLCEDEEYDTDVDSHYWYYVSKSRYRVGSRVPGDYRSTRIHPSDEHGRKAAGLAPSGRVGGTTIRSGGFGSGSGGYSGGGYSGGGS